MKGVCTSSRSEGTNAQVLRFDPPDRRTCLHLSPDARSDGSSTRPDRGSPCMLYIRQVLFPHPELRHVRLLRSPIPRATVPSRS
jgi:hypothetical protein